MPEVLVVDGTALLFRSYFGGVSVQAPDGTEVGAVMLSCNKLSQLVSRYRSTHVVVVFDAGQRTFRNDIDPRYKANRGDPPADLIPQFDLIQEASIALGFFTLSLPGYEADDLMATLARFCREAPLACRLVTVDKDVSQSIFDGPPAIVQQDPYKDRSWNEAGVEERMGVPPNQVCALMALVGDSTDNIPGVPGVGPKTAKTLIQHFGSIDALYDGLDQIPNLPIRGAKTLGTKLKAAEDDARLALSLVTLRSDVPLDVDRSNVEATTRWNGPQGADADQFFDRLGFHRPLLHLRSLKRTLG